MLERIELPRSQDSRNENESFTWYNLSNPNVEEILDCHKRWAIPVDYMSVVLDPHEISRADGLDQEGLEEAIMLGLLYPINELDQVKNPLTSAIVNQETNNNTKIKKESKSKTYIQDSGTYSVRLLSIIWKPGLLLTVTQRQLNIASLLTDRRRPDFHGEAKFSEEDMSRLEPVLHFDTPEDIIALLIWEINRQFIQASRILEQRRERVQLMLAHSGKTEVLMAISQLQESLVRFETAADENREVIKRLSSFKAFQRNERQLEWMQDILTESHQAEKMIGQEAKMLKQLNETFAAIISNNLNVTMKILTSLTIIITVPMIIAGMWGMNVALPLEDSPLAFTVLSVLSLVICVIVAYILKKKDLL